MICGGADEGPIRRAWARLKAHALHKKMPIDYHEHDLRAKSLSDEEELSVAIKRGDDSSGHNTTTKGYRRKAEAVYPLLLGEVGQGELLDDGAMDAHVAEYFCWLVKQRGFLETGRKKGGWPRELTACFI